MLMVIPEFNIAFEKAREITEILSTYPPNGVFVSLDDIIAAVKRVSGFSNESIEKCYADHPF